MGGSVRFTPLLGSDTVSPSAYLLQLATDPDHSFTLLLDAGWDERFDEAAITALLAEAPKVDAVLLSHPDIAHLGALPLLMGRGGMQAPVYATVPVQRMGQVTMRDACRARAAETEAPPFSLGDVDTAFAHITQLRWRQTVTLPGVLEGLSITPFPAGRLIGSSVWRISWQGEDFVYAVEMNHRKERLLNGAALESVAFRPAMLITDAINAQQLQPEPGNWEAQLLTAIKAALRADAKVLIATDAAGRVLELLLALERAWAGGRLPYPLALVTGAAKPSAVETAKSQLQWMADGLQRSFEAERDNPNPFSLQHVQLLQSVDDVERLPPGPAVVLASLPSMEGGPARELITRWATGERNLIVVPGCPLENSLAAAVVAKAAARDGGGGSATLQYSLSRRVLLSGRELADYYEAAEQQTAAEVAAAEPMLEPASPVATPARRSSCHQIAKAGAVGSEAGDGSDSAAAAATAAGAAAAGAAQTAVEPQAASAVAAASGALPDALHAVAPVQRREVLLEGFTPPEGAVAPMFPDEDEWAGVVWDEYGAELNMRFFEQHDAAGEAAMEADGAGATEMAEAEQPSKLVTERIDLLLRAQVLHLPAFEGRTDGRSQRTIIGHVAPRHLVIVNGSAQAREALAAHCRAELAALRSTVHVPAAGEAVDASEGCDAYRLALSPQLAAQLRLRPVGEYQLGWVAGTVGPSEDGGPLELLPAPTDAPLPSGQGGVFIGDVRLSDLKRALTKAGLASDWEGPGALVAGGGRVRVRLAPGDALLQGPPGNLAGASDADGVALPADGVATELLAGSKMGKLATGLVPADAALLLEGALCPEYYVVRNLLYGQYHIC